MILEHGGARPRIDPSARVAPNATLCGEVIVGANTSIGFGAVVTAESGPVVVGRDTVVMENAVLRGVKKHPLEIGDHALIGPHAMLAGCRVGDGCFVATGASVFNGAVLEPASQVRINGVVHINTRLRTGDIVPIGWVAVGDPATILAPGRHDDIWAIQKDLDFLGTVFGIDAEARGERSFLDLMPKLMSRYACALGRHGDDEVVG